MTCITHTAAISTPFCKNVDPYIYTFSPGDKRESTVQERLITTRELLSSGARHYVVYSDYNKRTLDEVGIYTTNLALYPGLIDTPVSTPIDDSFSGASYLINYEGRDYFFFVKYGSGWVCWRG
ncbi:hypothetical protein HOG98_01510 [bacterium]|nr:hypothetical protein [bacterium]